ncbi:hypothetical protein J6590_041100 [Homalodisca vitripennis]|nr:hypothetical protein J6590_041100 [Homalodisca vitripennis]
MTLEHQFQVQPSLVISVNLESGALMRIRHFHKTCNCDTDKDPRVLSTPGAAPQLLSGCSNNIKNSCQINPFTPDTSPDIRQQGSERRHQQGSANYRPIVIQPVLAKLFEKLVFSRIIPFYKNINTLIQPDFVSNRSITTNLVTLQRKLNNLLVTVNRLMLCTLNWYLGIALGIAGSLIEWFSSYLFDRRHTASFDSIAGCCEENCMMLNVRKCTTVTFHTIATQLHINYVLQGQQLSRSSAIRHLGVLLYLVTSPVLPERRPSSYTGYIFETCWLNSQNENCSSTAFTSSSERTEIHSRCILLVQFLNSHIDSPELLTILHLLPLFFENRSKGLLLRWHMRTNYEVNATMERVQRLGKRVAPYVYFFSSTPTDFQKLLIVSSSLMMEVLESYWFLGKLVVEKCGAFNEPRQC